MTAALRPEPTLGDRLVLLANLLAELEDPNTPRYRLEEVMRLVPGCLGTYGKWIEVTAAHLRDLRNQSIADAKEITRLRQMNAVLAQIIRDEGFTPPQDRPTLTRPQ